MTPQIPPQGPPYDVFISYAHADDANGWVTAFVAALKRDYARVHPEELPLTIFFDNNEISHGNDWAYRITNGVNKSTVFVPLLSPTYFERPWCRKEWAAWQDHELQIGQLFQGSRPFVIAPIPGLTDDAGPTDDLIHQAKSGQHKNFRDEYQKGHPYNLVDFAHDLHRQIVSHRTAHNSPCTVPACSPTFTGRREELLRLRDMLDIRRKGVVCGIHGLGGIGKTELAFAYSHGLAGQYGGGRFYISCESRPTLRDALLSDQLFLSYFEIPEQARLQPETHFAYLLHAMEKRLVDEGPMLLLLDNVDKAEFLSVAQFKPLSVLADKHLHVLATTRLKAPTNAEDWLALDRLPPKQALELLQKLAPFSSPGDEVVAAELVRRLDGLTLAIQLVGSWLSKKKIPYAGIQPKVNLSDLDHLAIVGAPNRDDDRDPDVNRLTVVLGWILEALTPEQRRVMEYAAFLPPDAICMDWLQTLATADFPSLGKAESLRNPWLELTADLEDYSLLTPLVEDEAPSGLAHPLSRCHRLMQEVIRGTLDSVEREALQIAVRELVLARADWLEESTIWPEHGWEYIPLEATAWLWEEFIDNGVATLLNLVGVIANNSAQWSAAESLFGAALKIDEKDFGSDHPKVASRLNNLAQLLQATNRLAEAEPLIRRALEIDERVLGKHHPNVAVRLNNLAQLLKATNRLTEAEPLMRRALEIEEKSNGEDHPKVATHLNNLAQLLKATNRLTEAEPLMVRALQIDEQNFGVDHPKLAVRVSNLAALYFSTHRLAEAEPLMRRALDIDVKSLGKDHPDVAIDLNNLAQLFIATDRYVEAEPLICRALEITEKSFGKEHPKVAVRLLTLASIYYRSNRLSAAEPLARRSLEIYLNFTRSVGHQHPHLQIATQNYSFFLQALGKTETEIAQTLHTLAPEFFPKP